MRVEKENPGGPLEVGSRVRVKQPRVPLMEWTVPGCSALRWRW